MLRRTFMEMLAVSPLMGDDRPAYTQVRERPGDAAALDGRVQEVSTTTTVPAGATAETVAGFTVAEGFALIIDGAGFQFQQTEDLGIMPFLIVFDETDTERFIRYTTMRQPQIDLDPGPRALEDWRVEVRADNYSSSAVTLAGSIDYRAVDL